MLFDFVRAAFASPRTASLCGLTGPIRTYCGVPCPASSDRQGGVAKRQESAKQDSRALTIKLQEQRHLNSEAIKAKRRVPNRSPLTYAATSPESRCGGSQGIPA